jgi:hypothetical protein
VVLLTKKTGFRGHKANSERLGTDKDVQATSWRRSVIVEVHFGLESRVFNLWIFLTIAHFCYVLPTCGICNYLI